MCARRLQHWHHAPLALQLVGLSVRKIVREAAAACWHALPPSPPRPPGRWPLWARPAATQACARRQLCKLLPTLPIVPAPQDPYHLDLYHTRSIFLADINGEVPGQPPLARYRENLSSLQRLVLLQFDDDDMGGARSGACPGVHCGFTVNGAARARGRALHKLGQERSHVCSQKDRDPPWMCSLHWKSRRVVCGVAHHPRAQHSLHAP